MAVKLTDLQLLWGIAGAREKFEELVTQLIFSELPGANRIRVAKGDGGIDAMYPMPDNGVRVFQIKFFPGGIGKAQREQIIGSFQKARETLGPELKEWTLCLPIDFSLEEQKWFESWRTEQADAKITPMWGSLELGHILLKETNQGIKDAFFRQEHVAELRSIHSTLTQLIQDLDARYAPPAPMKLRPQLGAIRIRGACPWEDGTIMLLVEQKFTLTNDNTSQSVPNWSLDCSLSSEVEKVIVTPNQDARVSNGSSYIRNNWEILPTRSMDTEVRFGVRLQRDVPPEDQIRQILYGIAFTYKAITPNQVGEPVTTPVNEVINWDDFLLKAEKALNECLTAESKGNDTPTD